MTSATILDWVTGVSTAIAVLVALGGYGFLEWQRRASQKVARRSSGHMIGIRLFRILNQTCDFERHFTKSNESVAIEESPHLLPPVHPLIGIRVDPNVTLSADEISLLIEMLETEFLSDLMLAASIYESIVLSLNEYRDRYEALYRMLPAPVSMDGKSAAHLLTREEILAAQPYSIQVFNLMGELRQMTFENVERCKKLGARYHPMMKERFRGEKFISFGEKV